MKTTNKVKHTPGPWKILEEKSDVLGKEIIQRRIYHERNGYKISLMLNEVINPNLDIMSTSEGKLNANLIAAAPELLEAVKAMQKATDEWAAEFTQKKRAMNWEVVNDAYLKASKAIAKAEGGTE